MPPRIVEEPIPYDCLDKTIGSGRHGLLKFMAETASEESFQAWWRLIGLTKTEVDLSSLPEGRVAAVLVLLHLGPAGDLKVTLTTRSQHLRSHPGDTALPGGRVDPNDASIKAAALREAHEEIGLPIHDMSRYVYVNTLPPFVSRYQLVVYPVVYLSMESSHELFGHLTANEAEVSNIFHIPLKSILEPSLTDNYVGLDQFKLVYSYKDVPWINNTFYRWHHFDHQSMPSPWQE